MIRCGGGEGWGFRLGKQENEKGNVETAYASIRASLIYYSKHKNPTFLKKFRLDWDSGNIEILSKLS